jgi:hypothetical protein
MSYKINLVIYGRVGNISNQQRKSFTKYFRACHGDGRDLPSNSIKCKGNLGKIIPVAMKYLIKPCKIVPVGHPRPTGVI